MKRRLTENLIRGLVCALVIVKGIIRRVVSVSKSVIHDLTWLGLCKDSPKANRKQSSHGNVQTPGEHTARRSFQFFIWSCGSLRTIQGSSGSWGKDNKQRDHEKFDMVGRTEGVLLFSAVDRC